MKKPRRSTLVTFVTYFVLYGLILLMVFCVMKYRKFGYSVTRIIHIDTVEVSVDGGPWETVTLPHTFDNLAPHTPVTVRTTIVPRGDDCLYVKTENARTEVYLDDQLVYQLGQEGKYPEYFIDPPPENRIIETHGNDKPMQLTVQYTSSAVHDSLLVQPYTQSSAKGLVAYYSSEQAAPMIMSLVQVIAGCVLIFGSLFLLFIDSSGQSVFWLGMFAKFSGIWFLCGNNYSILSFKNDSLLYLLSYIGMFSFVIPLLHFIRIMGSCKDSLVLTVMEYVSLAFSITALLLQLLGIIPFTQSVSFFRISIPLTLLISMIVIAVQSFKMDNQYARRLFFPVTLLTISAFMQASNYNLRFLSIFASIFQAAMFLFLFLIVIIAGMSFKDSLELKRKSEQLEQEKNILDIQMKEQRNRSLQLAQNEQNLSLQRHDLRHHLTAIQQLSKDNKELQDYLSVLLDNIPQSTKFYCENRIVNAIISHYAVICEQNNITLTTNLVIPFTRDQDEDSDLCVIFANLLENAVEACERMTEGKRYINLNSTFSHHRLTITMDNSFNGKSEKRGDRFLSSKRDDFGIGLSSVKSIAEAAHGGTDFHPENNTFLSSVYLILS